MPMNLQNAILENLMFRKLKKKGETKILKKKKEKLK